MISLSGKTKEKAVEDLLLQNYDQYYRLAYSYVHNEADAGDIVQNGAYKAIRSSSDLKEVRYAATWLYRIMLNEIFSFCKQKKTEPLEEGNDEPHYEDAYETLQPSWKKTQIPSKADYIAVSKNSGCRWTDRPTQLPTTFETHQRAASSTPFKRWLSPAITLRKDFYYGKP